jgi:hypothetical protein
VDWETARPLRRSVPEVGRVDPAVGREARMFRRVVLPDPEGPSRARISPGGYQTGGVGIYC